MTSFDVLIRGGTVVDGTGSPGRAADVGILGDRILAIGDLAEVDGTNAATVIDAAGRVVTPGFIDPHGHSDASLFVDGALVSHLMQGFTTQLSGNCGESLAPITDIGREVVELALRPYEVVARWRTFAEYLEAVEAETLGINVAFLVGHGTVRAAVMGSEARGSTDLERHSMVHEIEAALGCGAFGLSSGLIYAPGIHAVDGELAALVTAATRRGGLYATHIRNESDALFEALDEAVTTIRAAADAGVDRPRLQVSHLKCGSAAVHGRAAEAVAVLEWARADGLDVAADQYPYTAASTTLATILPPALLGLGVEECVAALGDPEVRGRVHSEIDQGISGWENVGRDPGWPGIRIAYAASHPDWSGRSLADLSESLGADPAELALDALMDDRLDVAVVIDCMIEADVETILAVPWIAVCTDASGRRPGHGILGAGKPHPRTYGSTARVLGEYVRDRGTVTLETAVAKLTSVPAARLGLRDRGVLREGAFADLVVFDATSVADTATYDEPDRHPRGIDHVLVNGSLAVLDGAETGERAGRLLRNDG
ncbi:MAG TPA: D-aminoacylase [Candidatus Limnocylindrales bacterium]|nr:D-aminoacylase [Candidatus Limnocylindrales bacterium]